ncbi:hypothetical protein [uncultured Roseobacter sp.]|uniref:hypothetical protein n=1 Tax=uncultured Roseobacter sp. TaxID=114847 RepID=UPI0026067672|nr:hypothetical protein [uncultured Roseobacter sp.]
MWRSVVGLKKALAATLLAITCGAMTPASATDLNAGYVALDMDPDARFPFISGVVEGIAQARAHAAGGENAMTGCIYHWFYEEEQSYDMILAAFAKFQDRAPGAIVDALIRRRCSE